MRWEEMSYYKILRDLTHEREYEYDPINDIWKKEENYYEFNKTSPSVFSWY